MREILLAGLFLVACSEAGGGERQDGPGVEAASEAPGFAAESGGVVYRFAGPDEGADILLAEDAYAAELQPAEIAIRAGDREADAFADLGEPYSGDVVAFTEEERARLETAIVELSDVTAMLAPLLPEEVLMVRTGAVVEGGLPHTRDNAIIFAGRGLPAEDEGLKSLFLHELHHILTRANPELMDAYFALLGYRPCAFEEPEALRAVRLTNPDAPTYGHYLPLPIEEGDGVIPFLHTSRAYNGKGSIPAYFGLGLLPVDVEDGRCAPLASEREGLLAPEDVPAFAEALGGNTGYVIHPEETLADNFTLWAMGAEDLPSPELAEKVGQFWQERSSGAE